MKQLHTMLLAATLCVAGAAGAADSTDRQALAKRGKQVFDKSCASCHAPGNRMPGTASLAAKYGGSIPAALEQRKDMTPEFIGYFVRNGVLVMPPFRKAELSDADLAALAAYLSHQ